MMPIIGIILSLANVLMGLVTIGIAARVIYRARLHVERRHRAFTMVLVILFSLYPLITYSLLLVGVLSDPLPVEWGRPLTTILFGALLAVLLNDGF